MEEQTIYYKQKLQFETDCWDLAEALKINQDIVVVDARSADSYNQEHIPGAISFPHRNICPETTENMDQSKLYVIYCDGIGCNASTKAAYNLSRLGFRVKELMGGLEWWKRHGYETHVFKAADKKEVTSCNY